MQERIKLLMKLREYLLNDDAELKAIKKEAQQKNAWFTQEFINLSVKKIIDNFLQEDLLLNWLNRYDQCFENDIKKTVGIVMAGNIPLVGFHDFLCVFLSGHTAKIKLSFKDEVLLFHLVNKLKSWNTTVENQVTFSEFLRNCDVYITTGSNNSGRYFEYYFRKYPSIIRKNRTSVGVLDGTETKDELNALADDIQLYFGLGCRNVTKLLIPKGYNFIPILNALKKYDYFIDLNKYKNNYDYQLALLMLNNRYYITNNSIILVENSSPFSPVSQVHYEFYDKKFTEASLRIVKNSDNIQCVVGHGFLPFGQAQSPALNDYADGVDTMEFLCGLK